jgi:hypothetical protein
MQIEISEENFIKLTDYCYAKKISYEEACNNILAEFFLERNRKKDLESKDGTN